MAFEIAQNDWQAVVRRQSVDFFVEHLSDVFTVPCFKTTAVLPARGHSALDDPLPICRNLDPNCRTAGDLMEPRSQRVFYPKLAAAAHQNEKRRLEGVLGIVVVADDPKANAQHHRTMSLDQGGKGDLCRLPAPACKLLKELTIRQSGDNPHVEQRVKVAHDGLAPFVWHRSGPRWSAMVFLLI